MNYQKATNTEKRSYQRLKKQIPIKIQDGDFDFITETKDISCTGAYCMSDRYIAPMTKTTITILLPSKNKDRHTYLSCQGIVVRIEKQEGTLEEKYNIALFFNEINESAKKKINNYVEQYVTNSIN